MGAKVGKLASVKYAGNKVAGMGTWNLSGFTRETLEDTEFGDDIKTFVFGMGDGGTVSFNGIYDPADTTGVIALDALCAAGTAITSTGTAGLAFYIDSTSYFSLDAGSILMMKSHPVSTEKNGLAQISFEGKISGGKMVLA
jgi:hypothetical protein